MTVVPKTMEHLGRGAAAAFFGAKTKIDRGLNEDTIRLAVTGLSRAGKTVFITSLIQNLLALGDGCDCLPALTQGLQDANGSRLRGVSVVSPETNTLPWFDYHSKVTLLASDIPDWPCPTDDVAEISLVLHIERKQAFRRLAFGQQRRVRLDILDYPGEWLLDLPLLKQSFQEWSQQTLKLLDQEPRRSCAKDFTDYVRSNLLPGQRAQEELIRRAHRLYRDALQACRTQHGLRYLQPGRFICPGPEGTELPFLWFFPMDMPDGPPKPGSMAELLVKRFEKYKAHVNERFFEPYFNRFNRQVLLVDVLGSLFAGRAAFEDTARAIKDIAKGLSNQRIARLSIVATKADHVPELSRASLRELLCVLAKDAAPAKRPTVVTFRTAASINSTQEGTSTQGDNVFAVVKGMVGGKMRPHYVGQVPSVWPPDHFWDHSLFKLPLFQPRRYDPAKGQIEHLGLDVVLNDIIGDLL